jgi:hypothetical protein
VRRHILAPVIVLTTLAATGCTGGIEEAADVLRSPSATASAPTPPAASPSNAISAPASGTPSPTERSIVVRMPRRGDDVLSPVVVSGKAVSASGEVLVEVLDAQGTQLSAMNARIDCGAFCRGAFSARLAFFVPDRQEGTIRVFEVGPGGSTEHLAQVEVTLVPGV